MSGRTRATRPGARPSQPGRPARPDRAGAADALRGGVTPARALFLQRTAGNRALARQVPKLVLDHLEASQRRPSPDLDPRRAAERVVAQGARPVLREPKPRKAEYATRSDAGAWSTLPEALREVLERGWREDASARFAALSDAQRSYLVYAYNRMLKHGIWDHVRMIKGFEDRETPVKLGRFELHVAGKTASIRFEVYSSTALIEDMTGGGSFGADTGVEGAMHRGKTSMREWARLLDDNLHISVGHGGDADLHFDKVSPTNQPRNRRTNMDWARGMQHWFEELYPELIRAGANWLLTLPIRVLDWAMDKALLHAEGAKVRDAVMTMPRWVFRALRWLIDAAVSGIQRKDFDRGTEYGGRPVYPPEREDPTWAIREGWPAFTVGPIRLRLPFTKEWRFGSTGAKARTPKTGPPEQAGLDEALTGAVQRALHRTGVGPEIRPSRSAQEHGDFAHAETVGLALAGRIMYRAKYGGQVIALDLGSPYDLLRHKDDVASVKAQVAQLGKAAREALIDALEARGDRELARGARAVYKGSVRLAGRGEEFSLL